jgi:ferredoxin
VVETVVFIQSQKVCQLSAECTLLDMAEKNGMQIPYGCRQGLCGKCATLVLSGPVQMDVEAGMTPEQKIADMCCLVLAGPRERLSCRSDSVLRQKIPASYRTFKVQATV